MGLCPPLSPLLSPLPPPPPPPPWSARHPSKYGMWTAFPGGYIVYMYYYMLMRDEKEGRKKQARSNKQRGKATQHTQVYCIYTSVYVFQATCNYTMSCIFMVSFLSLLYTFSYAILCDFSCPVQVCFFYPLFCCACTIVYIHLLYRASISPMFVCIAL